jgi:hypothetical protein
MGGRGDRETRKKPGSFKEMKMFNCRGKKIEKQGIKFCYGSLSYSLPVVS